MEITKEQMQQLLDHTIYKAKTLFPKQIQHNQIERICSAPLIIKSLSKAHAINVLISEDLSEEAEVILRVLIEISFTLAAFAKDPTSVKKYGWSAYFQKIEQNKNTLNAINAGVRTSTNPQFLKENLTNSNIELNKIIKAKGIKNITVKGYAEIADLLPIYYGAYSKLCERVHSGPEDVESYFMTQNRVIKSIGPRNNSDDILVLFMAFETMIRILKSGLRIFDICIDELKELDSVYQGLVQFMNKRYNIEKP
jgi:hypothetical protein